MEKSVYIFQEEITVLKISQRPQISQTSHSKEKLPAAGCVFAEQQGTDTIVKNTASRNNPKKAYIIISIKPQGHPNQKSLRQLILPAPVQQEPARQSQRQKQKQKK